MSSDDIILATGCGIAVLFLLAAWDWLPQSKSKDYLLKYHRGDDERGEW